MKKTYQTSGFTLIELIISIAIITSITVVLSTFEKDVFSVNTTIQSSLNAQLDARHVVKTMVTEIRKAAQSETGSYSVTLASSTGITFFSDVNGDGLQDQVRYFLSGSTIKKGVTFPTGSPATYNAGSEVLSTIINSVVASSTLPIFQYYSSSYAGTTTPLSLPVDIPSIRIVQITVIIDKDPNHSPKQIVVTSFVTLRNLKDNL